MAAHRDYESFNEFMDDIESILDEGYTRGYRLRTEIGDTHKYFLQSGGDFNVYLDENETPTFHEIRNREEWSEKSNRLYRMIEEFEN
jgi:hypothetical protein